VLPLCPVRPLVPRSPAAVARPARPRGPARARDGAGPRGGGAHSREGLAAGHRAQAAAAGEEGRRGRGRLGGNLAVNEAGLSMCMGVCQRADTRWSGACGVAAEACAAAAVARRAPAPCPPRASWPWAAWTCAACCPPSPSRPRCRLARCWWAEAAEEAAEAAGATRARAGRGGCRRRPRARARRPVSPRRCLHHAPRASAAPPPAPRVTASPLRPAQQQRSGLPGAAGLHPPLPSPPHSRSLARPPAPRRTAARPQPLAAAHRLQLALREPGGGQAAGPAQGPRVQAGGRQSGHGGRWHGRRGAVLGRW
jgi:hypothetical protein